MLPSPACGCEQLTRDEVWGHDYVTIAKLVAVSNVPATRFGDTITCPSQACSCERLTGDEVWGHGYVTIASLWLGPSYQRRRLGTRLRYHRKLVSVSNLRLRYHGKLVAGSKLPATRFGDTITLPSQACGCEQHTSDEVWGTRLRYHRKLVALSNLQTTKVWGHDYVTIASLWV